MQVENHKEEAPFAHYAELFRDLNPAAVTARLSDVRWDGKEFTLSLLGRAFAIAHPDYDIRALDGGALPPLPSQTFLLRYLLESKDVVWQGQWKTFREMPWGEMYIKPYTGRVLTRAAFTFGTRLDAFRKAAEKMGAPAAGVQGCLQKNAGAAHEARRRGLSVRPDRRLSDADSRLGRG